MTNEWNEFIAYTAQPVYAVKNKKDNSFLGRFTLDMIQKNYGFARILTILARGYLFHEPDGSLKAGDAYDRTDYARRALCAWCSIPESKKKTTTREEWQFKTDFRELHDEFPELVDENGGGWYYRHIHAIAGFIDANRDKVSKRTHSIADNIKELDEKWRKKVFQYQIPIFSSSTTGEWILRFDDVIADALELGALRRETLALTPEQEQWVESVTPKEIPLRVTQTLAAYYLANRQEGNDWVILPQANLDAYFGSTAFTKMYLAKLPKEFMERKESGFGVGMYKLNMICSINPPIIL